MCGIAGFCTLNATPLPEGAHAWLEAMTSALIHRGPDGHGLWLGGCVALGHRRLSIIDLSTGTQPMTDATGRVTITYNGEIYNFAEIRAALVQRGHVFHTRSDTEVILASWLEWGSACVRHFEGMFAFALWDAKENTLFCVRDRFGKKPFYYTIHQGSFIFASELTALTRYPQLARRVRPQSIMRYLAYEYVPTPESIYANVHKLEPAHMLWMRDGQIRTERYWDMPAPVSMAKGVHEHDIAQELERLLDAAVQRRMISDVPLGVFLSGGIDSSIVAGLMARHAPRIKTFSIGFQEASYDESAYARIVAQHYNTDHHERILSASECARILPEVIAKLDEPMADASVAPTYLLSGMTREHVTVALGGDGADELFAGYEHYIAFKVAEWYTRWPACLRKGIIEPLARLLPASSGYINLHLAVATFLAGAYTPAWLRVQSLLTALSPDMQHALWQNTPGDTGETRAFLQPDMLFAPTRARYGHWPLAAGVTPLARAFYVYVRQFLLDDILVKVDRCSMMHSLEVRAPFLDTSLAEFVARLPVEYKLRGFTRKYILKKTCAGILPPAILKRNKRGFQIPVAAWLRSELRPVVEDVLGEDFLRQQGLFHVPTVRGFVNAHMRETADHRKVLWTLLVLQLWWKKNTPQLTSSP